LGTGDVLIDAFGKGVVKSSKNFLEHFEAEARLTIRPMLFSPYLKQNTTHNHYKDQLVTGNSV
jgi:predicted metal-dependent enzyme (double-stranded beta helix superfamily)